MSRVQKILRNVVLLMALPLLVSAFVFAGRSNEDAVCKGFDILIGQTECSFVTVPMVKGMIEERQVHIGRSLLRGIDLEGVEKRVSENPWVRSAQAWLGADQQLHVRVEQRVPVIRLLQNDSSGVAYYLDAFADPIPLSDAYVPRLPVASVPPLGYNRDDLNLKSGLVRLAACLEKDSFWNAMITQIDMDSSGEIRLIPALGKQIIVFGEAEHMEEKFARLLAFYRQGLNTLDWTRYDELDVRFAGQVVARNLRGEVLKTDPYDKALLAAKKPATVASPSPQPKVSASAKTPAKASAPKKKEPAKASPKPSAKKTAPNNKNKPQYP